MSMKKSSGVILATAAAALFATGNVTAAEQGAGAAEAKVHCGGVNACKGQSDCATANNACGGQNACKGKGFKDLTKAECEAKGGTPMESKM